MGKYDDAMYAYLEDNERYAELFNVALFCGKAVLSGDMLEADDVRYQTEGEKSEKRFRDLKKRLKSGGWLAVTAIENQEIIDYTMPLRIMEYDLLEYRKQLKQMKRNKTEQLNISGTKVNSWNTRVEKADKLFPVHTICFYHGTDEWDGPKSLKDMMDFENALPGWEEQFHDYGISLFCANEVEDLSVFKTGLRQLLQVIPCRKQKTKLTELFSRDEYRHLDRDTAKTIAILTDNTAVLERLDEYETEGGYDMCQAMDELQQDWLAAGMEQGIEQGIEQGMERGIEQGMERGIKVLISTCESLGIAWSVTLQQLKSQYELPQDIAEEKMKLYWSN